MLTKLAQTDIRFLFLAALLIFLPGIEALKNIFAFLFVLFWMISSINEGNWGGKWRVIDSIFLLWILADIIISVNAVITHHLPGGGVSDILRFVLIGWVISRIRFSNIMSSKLALIALLGTLLTLAYSYYSGSGELRELHSVGHKNHTAIFLVIAYSISLSMLVFEFQNHNKSQKIFLLITSIILFAAVADTGSRAAFGLLTIVTLINFLYFLFRLKKFSVRIGFLLVMCFIGLILIQNPPEALKRIQNEGIFAPEHSERKRINNFSYFAFKANPVLGIGFGNYHLLANIKNADIKRVIIEEKGVFDNSIFLAASHAHNLYFGYIVSGGILIFSIFLWFWLYIFWIIFKLIPSKENEWVTVCSISVVMINLLIGLVNSTLHHEHAILSMFIFGLLASQYRHSLENKHLKIK
jgi:O-antigen ligase